MTYIKKEKALGAALKIALSCTMVLVSISILSCTPKEEDPAPNAQQPRNTEAAISKDKALYKPGELVVFSFTPSLESDYVIRVKHLNETIEEKTVSGAQWQWQAPDQDFRGYMVELYALDGEEERLAATIGLDVSSDWSRFPRYGFLSKYGDMSREEVDAVIDNLARHHINGLQFYDWHYKHHQPLAGSAANPDPVYQDIIGRDIHLETVKNYIAGAHEKGIKAMQYNLIFGALKNAGADGVSPEWYLYEDQNHSSINKHPLPQPPFVSDIFLTNPGDAGWQNYMIAENEKVYQALNFDGYHMDQLGNRGRDLYTYDGIKVDLPQTFSSFINAMREAHPEKYLALNAVNQYGQEQIASSPVSFLYTEVWDPNNSFADLARIIRENHDYSDGALNTVLAAYLNYDKANSSGTFNTPGVLLADAVIFAFGGAHLELGEHMLAKEYFPNDNLVMRKDLSDALKAYYDFHTAYQNLLRDGGEFNEPAVSSFSTVSLNNWPPKTGSVSVVGKKVANRQVLHLINFINANSLLWRDANGEQNYPSEAKSFAVNAKVDGAVQKVWMASPDINGGASVDLDFTLSGDEISFEIPSLKYWNMVVIEYQ